MSESEQTKRLRETAWTGRREREIIGLSYRLDAIESHPALSIPPLVREPDAPGEGDEAMVKAASEWAESDIVYDGDRDITVAFPGAPRFCGGFVEPATAGTALSQLRAAHAARLLAFARQHRPTASEPARPTDRGDRAASGQGVTVGIDLAAPGTESRTVGMKVPVPPGEAGKAADATLIPPSLAEWDSPPSAPTGGTVAAERFACVGIASRYASVFYDNGRLLTDDKILAALALASHAGTTGTLPPTPELRKMALRWWNDNKEANHLYGDADRLAAFAQFALGTTGKVRIVVPWSEWQEAVRGLNPGDALVVEGAAAAGEGEQR